jgi:anaerobic C4-dicarboxylate transporter
MYESIDFNNIDIFLTVLFSSLVFIAITSLPILFFFKKLKSTNKFQIFLRILSSIICSIGAMQIVGGIEYISKLSIHQPIWIFFSYGILTLSLNKFEEHERFKNYFYFVFFFLTSILVVLAILFMLRNSQYSRIIIEFLVLVFSAIIFYKTKQNSKRYGGDVPEL